MYVRLKLLRKKNKLTQAELSKETGKQDLTISLLLKLSRYYKTSPDYIIGDTDMEEPYGLDK